MLFPWPGVPFPVSEELSALVALPRHAERTEVGLWGLLQGGNSGTCFCLSLHNGAHVLEQSEGSMNVQGALLHGD